MRITTRLIFGFALETCFICTCKRQSVKGDINGDDIQSVSNDLFLIWLMTSGLSEF